MQFRDFFIIIGAMALTTVLTIFMVEKAVDSSSGTAPDPQTSATSLPQNMSDQEPPSLPITTTTSVHRFRIHLRTTPYIVAGIPYRAQVGTLEVQETRGRPDSRVLSLPVVRLFSHHSEPGPPVFLLQDGPGLGNVWGPDMPTWLLEHHDLVMVGYRGVDGDSNLSLPHLRPLLNQSQPPSESDVEEFGRLLVQDLRRLQSQGVPLQKYDLEAVIDDVEAVRDGLDFDRIHLYAKGYGAHLAYRYSLKYPEAVSRAVWMDPRGPLRSTQAALSAMPPLPTPLSWGDLMVKAYWGGFLNEPTLIGVPERLTPYLKEAHERISTLLPRASTGAAVPISVDTLILLTRTDDSPLRIDWSVLAANANVSVLPLQRAIVDDVKEQTITRFLLKANPR